MNAGENAWLTESVSQLGRGREFRNVESEKTASLARTVQNSDVKDIEMQTTRRRWVIGNWKMNGSLAANAVLIEALSNSAANDERVAVCVPFPYLNQAQRMLSSTKIGVGAQDVSASAAGAYTGQVSAAMLRDFDVRFAIVGHSERRLYQHETSEEVAAKAKAAVAAGLTAVVCVGETLVERDEGRAEVVVAAQLAPLASLFQDAGAQLILAYEPVWAIGTGRTASPDVAQAMHAFIRSEIAKFSAHAVETPILYGGSVKASNARELFAQPDIDGGLIGGAALVAADFATIVQAL
jgi:triosephosphate isomerase (TIM)